MKAIVIKRAALFMLTIVMMAGTFSAKAQLLFRDNHLFIGPRPVNYTNIASAISPGVYIGPRQSIEYWDGGLNFWSKGQYGFQNYQLFVGDNGNVGIGRKPGKYKLEVNGQVWTSAGLLITSDEAKKRNVISMKEQRSTYANKLKQLNGTVYDKLVETEKDNLAEISRMVESGKISAESAPSSLKELSRIKTDKYIREYGFIAQEVRKLFPELVDTNAEGVLSINYTGLIPVLVEAIKDLQERMEKFERGNKGISLQRGEVSENTDNTALGQTFKDEEYLSQNVPNPVDGSTVINYRLPEGAIRASIVVYSTNGAVVKTIPLDLSGTNGSITLYTSDLAKGVNLYQLTVNEVILGTKKLINP